MHMLADRAAAKLTGRQVANLARTSVRTATRGLLGLCRDQEAPELRRISVACRHDGSPLVVLHDAVPAGAKATLAIEGRAGRFLVTVSGTLKPWREEADRMRFTRRYPHEHMDDCCELHVLDVSGAAIESEGQTRLIGREDFLFDTTAASALSAAESGIIEHINGGHPDTIYALTSLRAWGAEGWIVTGIDPEGLDISLDDSFERIAFDHPVCSREDVKRTMIALRTAAGSPPSAADHGSVRAAE